MILQESGEMYLETILQLQQKQGKVRAIDVAEQMNFTKASVSRAMSILKRENFILVEAGGNIVLTDAGLAKAQEVLERHKVLTRFFAEHIGVPADIAEHDACRIEHVISPETFEGIKNIWLNAALKPNKKHHQADIRTFLSRQKGFFIKFKGVNFLQKTFNPLFATDTGAGYKLSNEVKTATPSLLDAAQIGVCVYENHELSALPDKDAILVTSFGTTYKETRRRTIDAVFEEIKATCPGVKAELAFTSHIVIERIKKNEGITYPTPEEALEALHKEGYTRVAICSLDIIPGIEYAYKTFVFNRYKTLFKKMSLGTPLMYWMGQEDQRDDIKDTMQALSTQFPQPAPASAVLLLAHGTPHPANAYYSVMQNRLNELGFDNAYIYSVEGWPHLDTVIPLLKAKDIKEITIMPAMMVAGDHANNDMAGDDEDSHKTILESCGFKVTPYLHGMGENENIRRLFVARALEAWQKLTAE